VVRTDSIVIARIASRCPGDPRVNGIVSQPLAFAMLHWITRLSDTLPAAFVAGTLSLLLVLFNWTGIIFFRPIVRAWLRRQGRRNELVNSATSGFTLYYGLLLGLLSVAAYQSSKEVEDAVSREASTLAALYRSCEGLPPRPCAATCMRFCATILFTSSTRTGPHISKDWYPWRVGLPRRPPTPTARG